VAQINKMTAKAYAAAFSKSGLHSDDGNLYLLVDLAEDGSVKRSSWVFKFTHGGKRREMGLGGASRDAMAKDGGIYVTEAREIAATLRAKIKRGVNPIEERREKRAAEAAKTDAEKRDASVPTVRQALQFVYDRDSPKWRSAAHRSDWLRTFKLLTAGFLDRRIDAIDQNAVADALRDLFTTKTETASRLRGRIAEAWSSAKATKPSSISGENPASLDTIDKLVTIPVRKVIHHRALDHKQAPALAATLRADNSIAPLGPWNSPCSRGPDFVKQFARVGMRFRREISGLSKATA
jgi:hypothetical protein